MLLAAILSVPFQRRRATTDLVIRRHIDVLTIIQTYLLYRQEIWQNSAVVSITAFKQTLSTRLIEHVRSVSNARTVCSTTPCGDLAYPE